MQCTFSPREKGDAGIWTAAPSHAHQPMIAAAASANSVVAVLIDPCPASLPANPRAGI
jgi:hypothetical protein